MLQMPELDTQDTMRDTLLWACIRIKNTSASKYYHLAERLKTWCLSRKLPDF